MARRAALRLRSAPGVPRFVSYYRVSTAQQGASGLGLEAQREAVARHVAGARGVIVAEFQEVESGKKNDRPQIAAALAACRLHHATLVIAKHRQARPAGAQRPFYFRPDGVGGR